ncbi:MAG: hypothetical protein GF307_11125 [candidate division Zixibacteria bacterium]|nr:hypothetical protein [candidate division Zixibacteria bacterium]
MFVLVALAVSLIFILSGSLLASRLFSLNHRDSISVYYSWGFMYIISAYFMMAAGIAGYLNFTAAFVWLVVLVIASVAGFHYWGGIINSQRSIFRDLLAANGWLLNLLILGLFVYIITAFVGALSPPMNLDVFNYHYELLGQYLSDGRITFNPTFFYGATPFTAEMISGFLILLSNLKGGQFIQYIAAVMMFAAVFSIARKLTDAKSAVIALAVLMSTMFLPFLIAEAKNDQVLALISLLSLYAFALGYVNSDSKQIILGAVFAGFAAGIKLYGLGIGASAIFVILIGRILGRTKLSYGAIAWAIVLNLLIASPWYLRSYFLTGNPFHPFFTDLFTDRFWDSTLAFKFTLLREPYVDVNLIEFILSPFRLVFQPDKYLARIGPVFLTALPVALLFRQKNRVVNFFLVTGLLYFIFWFLFLRDGRYLLPILPGIAVYCAGPLVQIFSRGKFARFVVFAVLAVNILLANMINAKRQYQKFPVVFGTQTKHEFYRDLMEVDRKKLSSGEYVPVYPEYEFSQKVNSIAEGSEAIGVFAYNEAIVYYFLEPKVYLLLPLWQNAIDFKKIDDIQDVDSTLSNFNIEFIVTDTGDDKSVPSDALLAQYPEFKSSLRGANIFLEYLHNHCILIISEGRYRCFRKISGNTRKD